MDLTAIQSAIKRDDILTTAHALTEALAEGLGVADVWASLLRPDAEIIEDYPTDPRGPSCLVLSSVGGIPVHAVVAFPSKRQAASRQVLAVAVLVTVYCPDRRPSEWSGDFRQRRPIP